MADSSKTQVLSEHQWKHRVLIVTADDSTQNDLETQITEFEKHRKGLKERKLIIYTRHGDQWTAGIGNERRSIESLNPGNIEIHDSFRIVLIGLDGGVKYVAKEITPAEDIFAVIDKMPMRRAEIRKGKL